MKLSKRLFALLMVLAMVVCLAACGDSKTEKKEKEESGEQSEETLAILEERANQEADVANARALKSLVVAQYMADDFEEEDSVWMILGQLSDDETADFYLSADGQSLLTSTSGAMKLSAEWEDEDYNKYVSCSFNCDCAMVSSEPAMDVDFIETDDVSEKDLSEEDAETLEEARQEIDIANVRALKFLVIARYMACDDGDPVWDVFNQLNDGETADFYLAADDQSLLTSTSGAMKLAAEWDDCDYGKYVSCSFDWNCAMVSSEPELPAA